jgi:hypothetical protein
VEVRVEAVAAQVMIKNENKHETTSVTCRVETKLYNFSPHYIGLLQ